MSFTYWVLNPISICSPLYSQEIFSTALEPKSISSADTTTLFLLIENFTCLELDEEKSHILFIVDKRSYLLILSMFSFSSGITLLYAGYFSAMSLELNSTSPIIKVMCDLP